MHYVLLAIQLCAFAISIIVLVQAIHLSCAPKARYFILLSIVISVYTLGYLMELISTDIASGYMATRVQFIGIPLIAPLFYLFVRDYVNRRLRSGLLRVTLFLVPMFTMTTALAYPLTRLYFTGFSTGDNVGSLLIINHGPAYTIDILYGTSLIALAGIEMLRFLPRNTTAERKQVCIFLLAVAIPLTIFLLMGFAPIDPPMDFGSLGFCISEMMLGLYIWKQRKEDWMPYARDQVIQHLQDGYVLLDTQGRFLDANQAAMDIFPQMRSIAAGTPAAVIRDFPVTLAVNGQAMREFYLSRGGRPYYYRVSANPVAGNEGSTCTAVMFYDSTELHFLMSELHELATRDPLTGLLNRSSFFKIAGRDFSLAVRARQEACLLMLDLDNFKVVNDKYGHQCGDDVLITVAHLMRDSLRSTDVCGRYGGEEFVVYLPGTSSENALQVAEGLRSAIEAKTYPCAEGSFHVTISIGLCALNLHHDKQLDDLVRRADQALYTAKRLGRNQVIVGPEVPSYGNAETMT